MRYVVTLSLVFFTTCLFGVEKKPPLKRAPKKNQSQQKLIGLHPCYEYCKGPACKVPKLNVSSQKGGFGVPVVSDQGVSQNVKKELR